MPWYRTITPEEELKTLAIRRGLGVEAMRAQQVRVPTTSKIANFTHVSAFQYLASGVRQRLFTDYLGESNIGIIVNYDTTSPRNVVWRDSSHCSVSDAIFKRPLTSTQFKENLKDHKFINVKETKVGGLVRNRYKSLSTQYKAEGLKVKDAALGWTEGLFRYQAQEIDGIVINPSISESCINGYAFLKFIEYITKKTMSFCTYNPSKLCFITVPREEVEKSILTYSEEVRSQLSTYLKAYESACKESFVCK